MDGVKLKSKSESSRRTRIRPHSVAILSRANTLHRCSRVKSIVKVYFDCKHTTRTVLKVEAVHWGTMSGCCGSSSENMLKPRPHKAGLSSKGSAL
jgi:hypothetical protein